MYKKIEIDWAEYNLVPVEEAICEMEKKEYEDFIILAVKLFKENWWEYIGNIPNREKIENIISGLYKTLNEEDITFIRTWRFLLEKDNEWFISLSLTAEKVFLSNEFMKTLWN